MEAVKAILILISFIISIFGVNSKINILCGNVNAFVYQGKNFFNLQVEIVVGIISIIILCSLIVLNRNLIIPSESSTFLSPVAFPKLTQFSRLIFFQYNN